MKIAPYILLVSIFFAPAFLWAASIPKPWDDYRIGSAWEDSWTALKMSQPAVDTALKQNIFEGGIEGIFPAAGAILPERAIRFQWRGELKGEKLVFVIFREGTTRHQIFPILPDTQELTVGTGHLLAAPSTSIRYLLNYRWYVGRMERGKPIAQSRVYSFAILAPSDVEALKNDLLQLERRSLKKEAQDFLRGQIFYHYRLYHDMVGQLKPLHQKFKSRAVQRLLFLGYVKLGKLHEAEKIRPKH